MWYGPLSAERIDTKENLKKKTEMNGTSWPKADEAGFSSLEPRFVKTTK
jgi:hypothetical protein